MKKIVLATALSISAMFAFDVGGALKNAGTAALGGEKDPTALAKSAAGTAITPEALGGKLADSVKATNTGSTSADKAKELCTQASSVQSFANINSDIVTKAISFCSEKVTAK